MRVDEALSAYLFWCANEKHYTPATLKTYGNHLDLYRVWLTENKPEMAADLSKTTLPALRAYLRSRFVEGQKASTQGLRVSVLRSFYSYLTDQEELTWPGDGKNPTLKLEKPRREQQMLEMPPIQQIMDELRFIKVYLRKGDAYDLTSPYRLRLHKRNRAALWLLITCGLRASEACRSKWKDLQFDTEPPTMVVHGKGNKPRRVYVGEELRGWLDELKRDESDVGRGHGDDYIFCLGTTNAGGRTVDPASPLSYEGLYYTVKDITRHHPHWFRHLAFTIMSYGGVPLRDIQEAAGHASPTTTAIYAAPNQERLASWAKSNPVNAIMRQQQLRDPAKPRPIRSDMAMEK